MHGNYDQIALLTETIELFKGLESVDPFAISEICHWHRYPKNSQILSSEEHSADVFFVVRGTVLARSFSEEGKEVSYNEIGAGGIFGEFSAIDGKQRSASVDAIEECVIATMTSADFRQLVRENGELGLRLAELLVTKSRALTTRIFEYGTLPVRARIQSELLRLCDGAEIRANQCTINPAPTHYEIATRIATHREAVSRELNVLALEKIIEIDRRKIRVMDVARLREMNNGGHSRHP
ncbi:MAG: Crp/Fnr family transcriptional regulator [Rhizobiaceae bacterium]